jgi:hypothetical protein
MIRKLGLLYFLVTNVLKLSFCESFVFKNNLGDSVKHRIVVHPKILETLRSKRGTKEGKAYLRFTIE